MWTNYDTRTICFLGGGLWSEEDYVSFNGIVGFGIIELIPFKGHRKD